MKNFCVIFLWLLIGPQAHSQGDDLPAIVDHVAANPAPSAVASVPWDRYAGDLRALPIGVFDSGIGGLTVLEAILKLDEHDNQTGKPGADGVPDFDGERFVYLGDQANMPYGNYSSVGKVDFLRELIVRDGLFLLGDNITATTAATRFPGQGDRHRLQHGDGLRTRRSPCGTREMERADPGHRRRRGRRPGRDRRPCADTQASTAAVLATVGTCASGAYPRTIATLAGQQGLQAPAVCQFGCAHLAATIEAGGAVDDCIRADVAALVDAHRTSGDALPISTVVLGCTHFPLVAASIERELLKLRDDEKLRPLITERLTLVNPAEYTAKELYRELFLRKLRLPVGEKCVADRDAFYITVGANGPLSDKVKYGRSPGRFDAVDVRHVPLVSDAASRSAIDVWRKLLPHVAERLK